MAEVQTVSRRVFWLVPLALLPLPLLLNPYQLFVAELVLMYVPVGVGFNVVVGNLGLFAFSNVAYFGIGAYVSGILMARFGLPWWLSVLPAGLAGALAGLITSIPALRGVRLFYLAIMTLAFGELMRWVYIRWEPLTGGSMGMSVPEPTLFGWPLDGARKFYVLLALAVAVVTTTDRLLASRFGRAFMAIRGNEIAAAAMGIPTGRFIVAGFAWGGFVVSIGGTMYAALIGHLSPDSFNLTELVLEFAIIMVGGLGSLLGSVLGAALLTTLPQFFMSLPGSEELAFGLLIILVILFLPRGLASLLAQLHPIFQDRYLRE
ncbi:MAG: branched-chain amino acid ABC transporter permease [Rhodospirillales bacterium]|nr:branched-chain amino acid ABC transporter permease [Rhodospirillales bacterium]